MRAEKLSSQPLIILAGPTASGKSTLALQLVETLRAQGSEAEILCADSITVYRGFDIGSAKPSKDEQAKVPHHLLDIVDSTQGYTAGDFIHHAHPIIEKLHQKNIVPIIVGGTGFYLRALLWGMVSDEVEDPEKNAQIKKAIETRAQEPGGWETLYKEVIALDPDSISTIHPNDHYRIQRALHAMQLYQKPWSQLNKSARTSPAKYPGMRYFCLSWERDILRERVQKRTEQLLQMGMLEEVKRLIDQGVSPESKPMQSVGYKDCIDFLSGKITKEQLLPNIVQETMRLAKSQRTWFQGEREVEFLTPEFLPNLKKALMIE